MSITYMVLSGSSQWLIGPNVTCVYDIVHVNGNKLLCPEQNEARDSFELINKATLRYFPISCFPCLRLNVSALTNNNALAVRLLSEMN